jgi:hypothetical protein
MAFAIALEKRTIRQMLVNTVFFHKELGIRAGCWRRSRRRSQKIKAGTNSTLIEIIDMFAGLEMLEVELVNVLKEGELVRVDL